MTSDDEGLHPSEEKLIPEWSVDADDQIIALGLVVVAAFLAIFGWTMLTGDAEVAADDRQTEAVAGPAVAAPDVASRDLAGLEANDVAAAPTAVPTTAVPTTAVPTTAVPTSEAPLDLNLEVAAALTSFGAANSTVDGTVATLTGFVGTDADRVAAGDAAADVPGITSVNNELDVLQPAVLAALEANDVAEASVDMADTIATLRGEVPDDASRTEAVAAAEAIAGVTAVVDELTISDAAIVTQLNDLFELEPIQFASNSAQILDPSFATLDQAVAILADSPASIEIQGYTDTRGPELTNLTLSQARADAVLAYLVANGVNGDLLQSTGYGETTLFGEGDTADALAANRRVRFELI